MQSNHASVKTIFQRVDILASRSDLFVVNRISQQHSIRGKQGEEQGRRGDKPTRGLCNLRSGNHRDDDHGYCNCGSH